jgi:polyhydroxyalkanoate synthesis regulator phasin
VSRLTISLTDEQRDWIEAEAEEQDCSKSQVVRSLIDDERVADSEVERRLDALERRVTTLERGGEPSGEQATGGEDGDEREVWRVVRDAIGDGWAAEEIVVSQLDSAVDWGESEFDSGQEVLETFKEQARIARRDGEVRWLGL